MNEASTSMKSGLFSLLEEFARTRPYFSFAQVRSALGESSLAAKPGLLREYLSEAMEKKVIHDSGRGWYSSVAEPANLSLEPVQTMIDLLSKNFPLLDFSCWSTIHWTKHHGSPRAIASATGSSEALRHSCRDRLLTLRRI